MNRYGGETFSEREYRKWRNERIPFPLDLRWLPNQGMFRLLGNFMYITKDGRAVCAMKEYVTDLGSIPAPLRMFVSVKDWAEAFVIHDWGCDHGTWADGSPMTQREADDLLKEIALYTGHAKYLVYPAYWLVRAHSRLIKDRRDK